METKTLDQHGHCPVCDYDWDGGSILESWKEKREAGQDYYVGRSDTDLEAEMHEFYSPPFRWSRLIGVEIQGKYDGVSEWMCPRCNSRWDRWTENLIRAGKKHLKKTKINWHSVEQLLLPSVLFPDPLEFMEWCSSATKEDLLGAKEACEQDPDADLHLIYVTSLLNDLKTNL